MSAKEKPAVALAVVDDDVVLGEYDLCCFCSDLVVDSEELPLWLLVLVCVGHSLVVVRLKSRECFAGRCNRVLIDEISKLAWQVKEPEDCRWRLVSSMYHGR